MLIRVVLRVVLIGIGIFVESRMALDIEFVILQKIDDAFEVC